MPQAPLGVVREARPLLRWQDAAGLRQYQVTITDAQNNTSEFFPPFGPTAAGVSVSGRVLISETQGIGNARLTLVSGDGQTQVAITNGFGYFRFNNVVVGRTYVLTVSHKNYAFSNPTRMISVSDELTDIDFTASP